MENYNSNSPTSKLWKVCHGKQEISSLCCKVWRVVEDQSRSSTRELVDTREEHEILENLLDSYSKPKLCQELEFKKYHYLLFTPFRYPPLKHGSRFGSRYERSLWYGALELKTSFGEAAFYRFLFFSGTEAKLLPCLTSHSAYSVEIKTSKGLALHKNNFALYQSLISKKDSYANSQPLGSMMREHDIEAFLYFSARVENQINVGVFTPHAFATPTIQNLQHWQCYTDNQNVEFTRTHMAAQEIIYKRSDFLMEGELPFDHALT